MGKRKQVDAKALAEKLINRQLELFDKDKTYKLQPSEMSWLLDVFKTMAEREAKAGERPLKSAEIKNLMSVVNGDEDPEDAA